jgi:hypothetical protein
VVVVFGRKIFNAMAQNFISSKNCVFRTPSPAGSFQKFTNYVDTPDTKDLLLKLKDDMLLLDLKTIPLSRRKFPKSVKSVKQTTSPVLFKTALAHYFLSPAHL